MTKKLYVGNLSYGTTDGDLTDLFSQIGEVVSAVIIKDKFSGRSKGFGFVEMSDENADTAIAELNGKDFDGRALNISEAKPLEKKPQAPRRDNDSFRRY
ncbi:MAG: RNA-binding protein [Candidatus Falkowbacteria bacterium]